MLNLNPIRVHIDKGNNLNLEKKNYREALISERAPMDSGRLMKSISAPRREGGNIVVELDVDKYKKGVAKLQFSIVGRISIQRGESLPMNMVLKEKLEAM